MGMSSYQNAGLTHNLLIGNNSSGNMVKFTCLRPTVTNQNCIHKEIKEQIKFRKCLLP